MQETTKSITGLSILLVILIVFWGFSDQKPSMDFMDSDDPKAFSVDNVMEHLKVIAKDVHHVGTPDHRDVQNYLVSELQKLGLEPAIQTQRVFRLNSRFGTGTVTENIYARIEGSGNGKALVLLSHYDSAMPHSYGASDDGSGIATILEGLRVFLVGNQAPKNDIIVLFTDAEELGLLGARAFIENHQWTEDIGLILNFEARGSGGPGYMLMETNGKNSKLVKEFVKANPSYPTTNSLSYSIYKLLPNDMDTTPFREIANINAYNFAFIDDHFDYHTAQDTYQRIDRSTLAHQADYLMSTLTYFSSADITDLNSDEDLVFVNFPIVKLIYYPFSWNLPLFIVAVIIFVALLVIGKLKGQINPKAAGFGFLPFLSSLIVCCALTYGFMATSPDHTSTISGF